MTSVKILQAGEKPVASPRAARGTARPEVEAPSPSETIVRSARERKTVEIALSSGRHVTVRRLSPLLRMMAAKAIGSELISNSLYANYALIACSIVDIDGVPASMPSSNREIEALINRIGEDFDELADEMKTAFSDGGEAAFDGEAVKN